MTRQTLTTHEMSHMSEKPYKCETCGKSFTGSNKLKRHKLVHSGVMEFHCSICGKQFNQKINKNTHEKKCKEASDTKYTQ